MVLGVRKYQNDIFQGSLGPKINRQSQNRQKTSKSHPKSDQKVPKMIKNGSKTQSKINQKWHF